MTAGMYKFLVSDYLNPALLPTGGARSGEVCVYCVPFLHFSSTETYLNSFIFAHSCIGVPIVSGTFVFELIILQAILVLFIQLFFCWRIWIFSMPSLKLVYRLLFTGLTQTDIACPIEFRLIDGSGCYRV
ncbi:hypothetical protein K443DRAFT_136852 [Laccaria amethystina LaAM-08-1]|uniref:Uncharacterized protein n=1 Tax=Laccaria amethystina LaAM-08-1 TaxID=1095629 RepID=A0A0C9YIC3_9AGAR|nr:hypothetical protein K443DRAFT_136852 [Laccaria amethystina LaAM-08-1]